MIDFSFADIVRGILKGGFWTVCLSLIAFAGGGAGGLAMALARVSPRAFPARLARGYIEFFQGTPLLMQLQLFFFGLAFLGYDISALTTAAAVLTLYASGHLAEIWRGCIEAIPRGQWEAGLSLAMTRRQQLRHIILPQALRIAVAPTVGFSVQLVKNTSVTSIIGFLEITKAGNLIANATFKPLFVYGLVGLFYFLLCLPLSVAARRLERRPRAYKS